MIPDRLSSHSEGPFRLISYDQSAEPGEASAAQPEDVLATSCQGYP